MHKRLCIAAILASIHVAGCHRQASPPPISEANSNSSTSSVAPAVQTPPTNPRPSLQPRPAQVVSIRELDSAQQEALKHLLVSIYSEAFPDRENRRIFAADVFEDPDTKRRLERPIRTVSLGVSFGTLPEEATRLKTASLARHISGLAKSKAEAYDAPDGSEQMLMLERYSIDIPSGVENGAIITLIPTQVRVTPAEATQGAGLRSQSNLGPSQPTSGPSPELSNLLAKISHAGIKNFYIAPLQPGTLQDVLGAAAQGADFSRMKKLMAWNSVGRRLYPSINMAEADGFLVWDIPADDSDMVKVLNDTFLKNQMRYKDDLLVILWDGLQTPHNLPITFMDQSDKQ